MELESIRSLKFPRTSGASTLKHVECSRWEKLSTATLLTSETTRSTCQVCSTTQCTTLSRTCLGQASQCLTFETDSMKKPTTSLTLTLWVSSSTITTMQDSFTISEESKLSSRQLLPSLSLLEAFHSSTTEVNSTTEEETTPKTVSRCGKP